MPSSRSLLVTEPPTQGRDVALLAGAVLAVWAAMVVVSARTETLSAIHPPVIAAIVAATIALPTLAYFASADLRALMRRVGQRRIAAFHVWRIPAAALFFWYGAQGELPTAFWVLAGVGDLLAGAYALRVATRPESAASYLRFHLLGFADFVVAVGTGLTFTVLLDPRMAAITGLPLALIPLFGVGLSGATHLIAFHMLRRGEGLGDAAGRRRPGP